MTAGNGRSIGLHAPDLNELAAQKAQAEQQKRVFIIQAEMNRVQFANQFLSLPDTARTEAATAAANACLERFFTKDLAIEKEIEDFVKA
jgi:hypothetical protein